VDDDPDVRAIVHMTLELTTNWRVSCAADGYDGVALATSLRPDGIVLDVMMPNMSGLGTAALLSRTPETARIPVVFLTAGTTRATGVDAAQTIAKPFDPLLLHAEIARAFGWEPT
jgi:CheY-like chemotaxis protein